MTLDERIRHHLEESTSSLKAPDRLEEVMAEGRRRRIRRGTFTVLGAAAVIAAVVTVTPLLLPADRGGSPVATAPEASQPPPSTTAPSPAPVTDAGAPLGMVVAGGDGVSILDREGTPSLELDLPGGDAVVAYPDQTGGIIYQMAPDSGDGSILRLTSDRTEPSVLVAPPPDASVVPIGPGRSPGGEPLFYYLEESSAGGTATVMVVDLASGDVSDVVELAASTDVNAGGSLLAMVNREDFDCPILRLLDLGRGELPSPLPGDGCLPAAPGVSVSADGRAVAILSGDNFQVLGVDGGDVLIQRNVPDAYMATAGPGGWVIRTPSETVLLSADGSTWSLPPVGEREWAIPFAQPFDLAEAAMTGSESDACPAGGSDLPDQDLPDEVAATRRQLWQLATSCDSGALADLARASETTLSFGGDVDPARYWAAEAARGEDPVTLLALLLTTRPAEDPEAGLWAWPAAHVDPEDEESWAEVADILGDGQVNQMRQLGTGYMGYRVGITSDGTWQFFVAGD